MRTLRVILICGACVATFGCAASGGSDARSGVVPSTRAASHDLPLVYAVNEYGFSATAYRQSANGNVSPVIDIAGSQTKIYQPAGLAVNRQGTAAVTNRQNDITFYAPGANGNVAPIATLACPSGGPGVPAQLAFDARGDLYVKYYTGHQAPSDEIAVYQPNQQSGCVMSTHVLYGNRTKISVYGGIAVGGGMIYSASARKILGFHTSDNGNVPPSIAIGGHNTGLRNANGIAVGKNGYLYVANSNNVLVFAPSANGNATPVATIGGGRTLIPRRGLGTQSVAVAKNGKIFVGIQNYAATSSSILVFAAGSNGNVAPIQVITGSNTGLDSIEELSVLD
ncbi:MAG: hypothetical protein WA431_13115 [Candidatus Cybelea sp.]